MKRASFLALVCFALSGCATAQIAQGPSIASLKMRDNKPLIVVAMVKDARGKTSVGTIGAAGIAVPETVKNTVHNYLVNTLYDNFAVNAKGSEGATGSEKLVSSQIDAISIYSFDAIMQPVDTEIRLKLSVLDAQEKSLYEQNYAGMYQERIGMSLVETKTGQLVEEAIRNLMAQIAGDDKLKKVLENV